MSKSHPKPIGARRPSAAANNFKIGGETLPQPLNLCFGAGEKAAAATNVSLGRIKPEQADLITQAADDVLNGKLDGQFPLVVWQTGSGTQSNMNMNEVLATAPTKRRYGFGGVSARPSQRPCEPRAIDQRRVPRPPSTLPPRLKSTATLFRR